jgi:hypothetical protein
VSLVDFSSLVPDEERRFVPFERAMRDNGRRALVIGLACAGGLLAVLLFICVGLYTPCNTFCARPPNACRAEPQLSAWRARCESSCSAVEHASGFTVDKERVGSDGAIHTDKIALDGTAYLQTLNACVFSGGRDATCSSAIKTAAVRGLWCEDGK